MTPVRSSVDENQSREQIVAYGRSLFKRGLVAGSSGNLNMRLYAGQIAEYKAKSASLSGRIAGVGTEAI